jgi:hypothetical protein
MHEPLGRSHSPSSLNRSSSFVKPVLAGGLMFAFVGLLIDFRGVSHHLQNDAGVSYDACQDIIQADTRLSREQLAQLLAVSERDSKERIRQIVAEPYCKLPAVEIRAGVTAEREAYPLAFDPEVKLVLLYEGDEYAGYRFSFEQQ